MGGQIDALVQRNTVMMDRAERLKEEDLMAGVGFLVLLPMITGVVKMLADLVLVILGILFCCNNNLRRFERKEGDIMKEFLEE